MEHCRQPGRRVLLHGWERMGVDRKGDLDLLAPELLLDVRQQASLQGQRRAGVAEPVELDCPDLGGL